MKYFRPHEFNCRCGKCGLGFPAMDVDFLDRLDSARIYANVPFKLTSAYRCEDHNRDEGGTEGSAHTKGVAVDIAIQSSHVRFKVLYGLIKAGFNRIGVYENFIHVDDDMTKAPEVCWFGD